jgi:hypothetical protein
MKGPYDGRFGDISSVTTNEDAARIANRMMKDVVHHPGDWSDRNLVDFLGGLEGALMDMPIHYALRGEPVSEQPTWQSIAEVLVQAGGYTLLRTDLR